VCALLSQHVIPRLDSLKIHETDKAIVTWCPKTVPRYLSVRNDRGAPYLSRTIPIFTPNSARIVLSNVKIHSGAMVLLLRSLVIFLVSYLISYCVSLLWGAKCGVAIASADYLLNTDV